jgi:hypothetical protein
MRVSVRILIATKDTQGLFHKKEGCKSYKYPQAGEIENQHIQSQDA